VASTLPNLTDNSFWAKCWAAFAYSGANCLQWPHHGASTKCIQNNQNYKINK